jgi:hypothetical protein
VTGAETGSVTESIYQQYQSVNPIIFLLSLTKFPLLLLLMAFMFVVILFRFKTRL